MPSGPATLIANLGAAEIMLIFLVTVPFLILPVLALVWVFRLGKRTGAAEARQARGGAGEGRDDGRDSRGSGAN